MSSAGRPVKLKTTLMTGMLMFGKMSVGVRKAEAVPKIRISTAMTMNVYGRRKARRTIPIMAFSLVNDVPAALALQCLEPPQRRFRLERQLVAEGRQDHAQGTRSQ